MTIKNSAPAVAIERSGNSKIGTVSATYASQASCPSACPFYRNGCYAENGPIAFTTRRLNAAPESDAQTIADSEAAAIRGLSGRLPLRLHVVGDSTTDAAARAVSGAAGEHSAKHGAPVWTYTHAWRDVDRASWGNVSVLASCEDPADITAARDRGYATAIVYDTGAGMPEHRAFTLDGARIVPCPEQSRGVKCTDCRLCWDDRGLRDRGVTIGFYAHGAGRRRVADVVRGFGELEDR